MSAQIIDGKKISQEIKDEVKASVSALAAQGKQPCLAVVLVGDDPASAVYVGSKKKACEYTGIKSVSYELPSATEEAALLALVAELNADASVHGILVQMPLPKHMNEEKILLAIAPEKDVDGFHPYNVGAMNIGGGTLLSCTPAGVIELLKRSSIEIAGQHCVVIGRSNIVGKPAAALLLREHGTVTICHSRTANLAAITSQADILVAAVGKPKFVTAEMVKDGAAVIDVGVHRIDPNSKKLCGDVDYEPCAEKAAWITPVPGGVGPMTIAMLMKNCLEAYRLQNA